MIAVLIIFLVISLVANFLLVCVWFDNEDSVRWRDRLITQLRGNLADAHKEMRHEQDQRVAVEKQAKQLQEKLANTQREAEIHVQAIDDLREGMKTLLGIREQATEPLPTNAGDTVESKEENNRDRS